MRLQTTDEFLDAISLLVDKNRSNDNSQEREQHYYNPRDRPFRLGKIDPDYSSGRPRIIFDGETQVSIKRYPYLANYEPRAGDVVLLASVGNSYIVIGKRI